MTETSTSVASDHAADSEPVTAAPVYDQLHTPHGDTTIADGVVQKIAVIAAREVSGVYAMGNAAGRAINQLAGRISSQSVNISSGVTVQTGEREAAIVVSVVVEYGTSIVQVSEAIRQNIIAAVEYGTGLTVVRVDVAVSDVHLPDENDDTAVPTADESALR